MYAAARMNARYVVISPVRDEDRFLERTLESVLSQSILPVRWVIVDDGSVDRTPEILSRFEEKTPWISVIGRKRSGGRQLGTAEIVAFNAGYETLDGLEYDYIVKLDCDLVLPPNYFEALFAHFDLDPRLGIASGVYLEVRDGRCNVVVMPSYHAAGASKVLRRSCFQQIGGFVGMRGWDTVDEIKAQAMKWHTRHFREIQFHHLKPEGEGSGWRSTQQLHGEVYYRSGGSKLFFLLKVLHRAVTMKPLVLSATTMLCDYLKPCLMRAPKLVTAAEGRLYRQMQYSRLVGRHDNI